jgi:hypothetical protein
VYRRIDTERSAVSDTGSLDHSYLESELDLKIKDLQSVLLEIEMKLQDALLIGRKQFISKVQSIIEDMKTLNQEYIQNVLNEVVNFNEKFKEAALLEHERFHAHANEITEEELLAENEQKYMEILLIDWAETETLMTLLENFKEFTENKISNFESVINSAITKDWKATEARITQDNHSRNRDIILEIVGNTKKF